MKNILKARMVLVYRVVVTRNVSLSTCIEKLKISHFIVMLIILDAGKVSKYFSVMIKIFGKNYHFFYN